MSYFDVGSAPEQLIARRGYAGLEEPMGGFFDKVGSFLKGAGKSAISVYDSGKNAEGQAQALKELEAQRAAAAGGSAGLPSWAMPAAAVAAGVALFVLLKKKRSNPARRPGLRRSYMYEVAEVAPGGARVGHTSVVAYSRDHAKHVYAKEHGKSPGTTVKVYKTP